MKPIDKFVAWVDMHHLHQNRIAVERELPNPLIHQFYGQESRFDGKY
jgi:hypothetical protein